MGSWIPRTRHRRTQSSVAAMNRRAVRGASEDDGWARAGRSGAARTAWKARKYPRRKIVGATLDPVGKMVDLLECGHTNWPEGRGAAEAAWTICDKCPPKVSKAGLSETRTK